MPRRAESPPTWPALVVAAVLGFSLAAVFGNTNPPPPTTTAIAAPTLTTTAAVSSAPAVEAPPHLVGFPTKPPGWKQLDPGPLVSRMGHGAAWTGEAMVIWGGRSLLNDYTSGGVYRDSGTEEPAWKFIAAAPIDGGTVSATAWTGDALFVHTTSAAWYLPAVDTWKAIVDPAIADLDVVAAAWTGDQLVVLGAAEDSDTSSRAYSLGSPADATCCRRLAAPPFGADRGVLVPIDDGALFIGGHSSRSDEAPFFATYRPVTDTWIELEPPPLVDGPGLDATWSEGMLVAIDHTLTSAGWTPADGWHALPDLPFEVRGCYPRSIAFDDSVFVWHCRDAAWLVPESGRWATIATPELPSHTVSTSCLPLAAESTVLLWCGNGDGSTPLLFEAHALDAGSRNDPIDS